ncbi:hypothetical protein H310_03986 [Aphanomyces invadans]|uniref:ZZ-type domain-containing protein n=1 Tax=Aphanomyces invadans TaxID=157072 RepID=A0A024UF97_9STRA|nr:hypothetical protein H310_03986 [Aphanomyces invadans]ETW04870.1 hypothetical protein H310_03986 [Aphanomyces invadans]|eukprot:XP_008866308.1 hypothetical protein H310_03986 [Aphanomyces invadans]
MQFALCTKDTVSKVDLCDYDFLCANATAFLNVDGTTAEFSYADMDGDVLTIKNQTDVDEAIEYMKVAGLDVLRIDVRVPPASSTISPVPNPTSVQTPPEVPSPPPAPIDVPAPTPSVPLTLPVIHSRRVCDGCNMYPIVGTRFRPTRKPGLDFCTSCVAQSKWQHHAPFETIDKELVTHDNVTCDGCQMSPLEGVRYKSAVVDDFDLCATCEASGKWAATHEPFLKITHPCKSIRPNNVHDGVVCDGCNMHPIVGARFKSAVIKNFDLCETCERSGKWNLSHGPMLKIYIRKQTPVALYVATTDEDSVQTQEQFTAQAQEQHQHRHHPHHHHPHPHHHHPHHGHHHHHHNHQHGPHHDKSKNGDGWKSKREFWKQHCHEQKAQWKEQFKAQKAQWKQDKKHWKRQQHSPRAAPDDTTVPSLAEAMAHIKAQLKQHFTPERVAEVQDTLKVHLPAEMFEAFKARSDEWLASVETSHQAMFVEDVTVPDGTVCFPGEALSKKWRLRNTGSNAWPVGCKAVFEGGVSMACDETAVVVVPPLAPGADCVVEMVLIAPQEAGRHASHFRLSTPSNVMFGERFWIDVVVDAEMAQAADDNMVANAIPLATLVVHDDEVEKPMEVAAIDEVDDIKEAMEAPPEVVKDDHVEETASEASSDDFVAVGSPADVDALEAEAEKLMDEQGEFATELAMLGAMGFENNERLRALLTEFEGNLEKVVEKLLE